MSVNIVNKYNEVVQKKNQILHVNSGSNLFRVIDCGFCHLSCSPSTRLSMRGVSKSHINTQRNRHLEVVGQTQNRSPKMWGKKT